MENAARNVRICTMFAEGGRTHQQIGEDVGVSRFVVRNALAEGVEYWQEWERKAVDAGMPQLGEPEPSDPLSGAITMLPLDDIAPNPWQPRDDMDEEALILLSDDIYRNGLLSPVLVRENGEDDSYGYELVYGQRRLEAFRMLDATDWAPPDGDMGATDRWVAQYYADGVTRIPAIVRTMNSEEVILASLSENMAREDLTWLEETRAFKRALDANVGLSQRRLARIVGTSPTNMSDRIRMLQLPNAILDMVGEGKIAWTAARELLGFVSPSVVHQNELDYLAKVLPKCREIKDYGRVPTEELRKHMLRVMGYDNNQHKWEHLCMSTRDMYIGEGSIYKRPPVMDPSEFIAANPGYIHTLPGSWGKGTITWTSRGPQWRAEQEQWLEEQKQAREQAAQAEREETQENDGDNWKDREPPVGVVSDREREHARKIAGQTQDLSMADVPNGNTAEVEKGMPPAVVVSPLDISDPILQPDMLSDVPNGNTQAHPDPSDRVILDGKLISALEEIDGLLLALQPNKWHPGITLTLDEVLSLAESLERARNLLVPHLQGVLQEK